MKAVVSIAIFAALLVCVAFTPPKGYGIGDEVADFSLKNVDGRMVSLSGFKTAKGLVVVFTGNKCPFARLYEDRLNKLNKKYSADGFKVIAINSNNAALAPEDTYENMVAHAREKKLLYPYLHDETQAVAKAFGATKTPQAFVLFRQQGKWILKYSGAIDDNGAHPEEAKNHYVEDAIQSLLHNEPVAITTTKSVGCTIKWKE